MMNCSSPCVPLLTRASRREGMNPLRLSVSVAKESGRVQTPVRKDLRSLRPFAGNHLTRITYTAVT
jgi:hypothetical protein